MSENKPFKILSIDGGGIKGLYSATVLSRLEEKAGRRAGECFDMICGTSTGGIIALGVASGEKATDLAKLYSEHGKSIFPTSNYRFFRYFQSKIQALKQTLFWGKYSAKQLKKQLTNTFKEKKLGELDNLVCIPSFNLTSGLPRVFKFPHKEGGFFMDKEIPLVDAALATSAAPTYLPIHEYNDTMFVDGGVWANNPSLCGLLEALKFFVGDEGKNYTHVELLSIASISQASGWAAKSRKRRSFIGWKSKLMQTSMDGQAYFTHFFIQNAIKKIDPRAKYVRIESPKLSCEQMEVLEMDRADKRALATLKSLGNQDGYTNANIESVMNFFKTDKTYKTQ
ncbi:patatin-like phospholipase family protein [Cryomorpha ignava]|uniref:Patatin-like phospholipase family protein n=1 Tax=Cryomorpha ignava TaxID=101383 RepID=A0A7K3WSN5_9FLAO|nr:CBASS cGAMP-activated phospholipase [Cryomorpha ignava]NEN24494.1 patatin-like phospholipase family protein [Cryomorpha ignava]